MARRYPLLFWVGMTLFVAYVSVALMAPAIAPHDPLLPTGEALTTPGSEHWLGTNHLGQDILSQLIHGARVTVLVALCVAAISTSLSWIVGLTAGFFRRASVPLMSLADIVLALPNLPLFLLVLVLVGPSLRTLILTLGLLSWAGFARIIRSIVLRSRSAPYVEAARAIGATEPYILRRHLFPQTLDVLPTKLVLSVRFAVFAEATLAFLGIAAASVSWGTMLSRAFNDPLLFSRDVWPWIVLPPTLAIVLLVLATVWVASALTRPWLSSTSPALGHLRRTPRAHRDPAQTSASRRPPTG